VQALVFVRTVVSVRVLVRWAAPVRSRREVAQVRSGPAPAVVVVSTDRREVSVQVAVLRLPVATL